MLGYRSSKNDVPRKHISDFLLSLLLHYKWLFLVAWIAGMIFLLVSEIFLLEPVTLDTDTK